MARPEKVAQVDAITAMFNDAQSVILSDFTGLNVEKISELRRLCRENNVQFRVVKNSLARLGIKGTPAEGLSGLFEGPTAVVCTQDLIAFGCQGFGIEPAQFTIMLDAKERCGHRGVSQHSRIGLQRNRMRPRSPKRD